MVYHIPGRDRAGLTVLTRFHLAEFPKNIKESFIAVSAHQSESYYSTLFNQFNPLCNALNIVKSMLILQIELSVPYLCGLNSVAVCLRHKVLTQQHFNARLQKGLRPL